MTLDERLKDIEERLNDITPWPWRWIRNDEDSTDPDETYIDGYKIVAKDGIITVMDDGSAGGEYSPRISPDDPDGILIERAPTDIALLLEMVKVAREALKQIIVGVSMMQNQEVKKKIEEHVDKALARLEELAK